MRCSVSAVGFCAIFPTPVALMASKGHNIIAPKTKKTKKTCLGMLPSQMGNEITSQAALFEAFMFVLFKFPGVALPMIRSLRASFPSVLSFSLCPQHLLKVRYGNNKVLQTNGSQKKLPKKHIQGMNKHKVLFSQITRLWKNKKICFLWSETETKA